MRRLLLTGLALLVVAGAAVYAGREGKIRLPSPPVAGSATPAPVAPAPHTAPPPSPTYEPAAALYPRASPEEPPEARPPWLAQAAARHQEGDYPQAIAAYQAALAGATVPEEAKAILLSLGTASLQDGQYGPAAEALESFLRQYPEDKSQAEARFLLARAYQSLGRWEQAVALYRAAAAQEDLLRGYAAFQIGDAFWRAGDWPQAIAAFSEAAQEEIAPLVAEEALEKQAEAHLKLGQYTQAIALYQRLLRQAQGSRRKGELAYRAGMAAREGQRADLAEAMFRQVVDEYPESRPASLALDELRRADPAAVSPLQQGMVHYYAGQYEPALAAFAQYLARRPPGDKAAQAHYYAALAQRYRGNHQETLAGFARLAELYPEHPLADDALWQAGLLLESSGRCGEAAGYYGRLAQAYGEREWAGEALFRQGLCAFKSGHDAEAQRLWESLLRRRPTGEARTKTLLWLGKASQRSGYQERAEEYLKQAAAARPRDYYAVRAGELLRGPAPVEAQQAVSLGQDADDAAERAALERWLGTWVDLSRYSRPLGAMGPELREDSRVRRGTALLRMGLGREALGEFNAAIWRWARDPVALYRLALFFREKGLPSPAMVAAARLLSLSPARDDPQEAPRLLQKLLYPFAYSALVRQEAQRHGLDPLLLLALIRQESWFNPYAISVSQARGLTQVIPSTAREIAQALRVGDFQQEDLFKPYRSIQFGAWYLAVQHQAFQNNTYFALAAYNGGGGNVRRWIKNDLRYDPDLFVEDISLKQTEKYVKLIAQHYRFYRELYAP